MKKFLKKKPINCAASVTFHFLLLPFYCQKKTKQTNKMTNKRKLYVYILCLCSIKRISCYIKAENHEKYIMVCNYCLRNEKKSRTLMYGNKK